MCWRRRRWRLLWIKFLKFKIQIRNYNNNNNEKNWNIFKNMSFFKIFINLKYSTTIFFNSVETYDTEQFQFFYLSDVSELLKRYIIPSKHAFVNVIFSFQIFEIYVICVGMFWEDESVDKTTIRISLFTGYILVRILWICTRWYFMVERTTNYFYTKFIKKARRFYLFDLEVFDDFHSYIFLFPNIMFIIWRWNYLFLL